MPAPILAAAARSIGKKIGTTIARRAASHTKAEATRALAEGKTLATRVATANLLRISWLSIIPTFGLTLLYINVHFIVRYFVRSDRFSRFGVEWNPVTTMRGKGAYAMEYAEIMALVVLDLILLALFLTAATLIGLIVWGLANPVEFCRAVPPAVSLAMISILGPAGFACAGIGLVSG